MFESRYSKVLTVILIIIIIAIVGLLGFLAYDYIKKSNNTKQASDFVENYEGDISTGDNSEQENEIGNVVLDESLQEEPSQNTSGNSRKKKYKGYTVAGTIKIPSINVEYPILEEITTSSLDLAVAVIHPGDGGDRLNKPGNVVIAGHNYRNGTLFSNVKKLSNGAKIYITDYTGKTLTYEVYNKFEANEIDTSFYDRDTNGLAEVTLSTCTDASNDIRTIVFAKQI
ncbi:MAG: sortase [Clostridia bacterium]|nr:sortase [Clostridia bacterium]